MNDFGFWISHFGFQILDFGFWFLDFGFWILDCRSIRSFCDSPERGRLDFGFWILDRIIATTRRLGSADFGVGSCVLLQGYERTPINLKRITKLVLGYLPDTMGCEKKNPIIFDICNGQTLEHGNDH